MNLQLQSTKQQIITCLESLTALEIKSCRRKFESVSLNTLIRQYARYCRLLRLVDAQFSIENTTRNQLAIVFVARKLEDFFWRVILRLPPIILNNWDTQSNKEFLSKDDLSIYVSRQMTCPSRLRIFQRRRDVEHTKHLQKMFRQELLKSEEFSMEMDVETRQELMRANLMDIDDACLVIQCAERMYQAIARFYYLTEVRKKAVNFYTDKKVLDTERAVIMIQARTRGFLARKRVCQMRTDEQKTMALGLEAMLLAKVAHRKATRVAEALHIRNVLEMDCPSNSRASFSKTSRNIRLEQPSTIKSNIRLPETLSDYMELVRADLFMTDPLHLTTEGVRRLTTEPNAKKEMFKQYNQETENLFTRLASFGVCRTELGNAKRPGPAFDELITFNAEIRINRKHTFVFDLRNFIYMAAVIPHMCSGWSIKRARRGAILFVGAEGSGKTAWANALAHKCGATCITITKLSLKRKNRASRLLDYALQFARRDGYAVIVLDLMDIFARELEDKRSTTRAMVRKFLRTLLLEDRCFVVGASRSAVLEPSVIDHFAYVVQFNAPSDIDRLQLLAENFSRRLENDTLTRLPKRLADMSKSTSALTCGGTLRKSNRKFSRNTNV